MEDMVFSRKGKHIGIPVSTDVLHGVLDGVSLHLVTCHIVCRGERTVPSLCCCVAGVGSASAAVGFRRLAFLHDGRGGGLPALLCRKGEYALK